MKKVSYKCDLCGKVSVFLNQDIWDIKVPIGYSGKPYKVGDEDPEFGAITPYRLIVGEYHACLDCGVKIYGRLMKIKKENKYEQT